MRGTKRAPSYDPSILLTTLALMGLGLVQVYSSSYIFAIENYGDGFYFFKRQLLYSLFGACLLFWVPKIPWRYIRGYSFYLWIFSGILLSLTLIPGIGIQVGGASRWLPLVGGLRVEPGEFLKVGLVGLLALYVEKRDHSLGAWQWPLRFFSLGVPLGLLLFQPDFGTFALGLGLCFFVIFSFGFTWKKLIFSVLGILPLFLVILFAAPYRRRRILAFMDPWSDPDRSGFQLIQSMLSFHSGGLLGSGLGEGQGKLFFLPAAHTDFTLAVLGEEMGYLGFLLLLGLYGLILLRGFQTALSSRDLFLKSFALGLTLLLALSVFTNVGVVLGLLPTKGLTLPFLSYGGSSLLSTCLLVSLLLSAELKNRSSRV